MFCLEINTKIKGSKISGIHFLNFHSWNCSRILENSFRENSFPGIKKSWKILSWKKIVLEFSQNNLYFPWNLQFWNFPFLEFSTPGILSWNFLFLESYFTEFSCYPYHLKKAQYHEGPLFLRPHCGQTSEHISYSKVSNERYVHYLSNDTP